MWSSYFRGWPLTVPIRDGYRVRAWHRSPGTLEAALFIRNFGIALSIVSGYFAIQTFDPTHAWLTCFLGVPLSLLALHPALRFVLRKQLRVDFLPGTVAIKGRRYDSSRVDGFDIGLHRNAQDEERELDRLVRIGKLKLDEVNGKRKYSRAHHLYLRRMGEPVEIAAVYGEKDAETLAHRLNTVFNLVNNPREWAAWEYDVRSIRGRDAGNEMGHGACTERKRLAINLFAILVYAAVAFVGARYLALLYHDFIVQYLRYFPFPVIASSDLDWADWVRFLSGLVGAAGCVFVAHLLWRSLHVSDKLCVRWAQWEKSRTAPRSGPGKRRPQGATARNEDSSAGQQGKRQDNERTRRKKDEDRPNRPNWDEELQRVKRQEEERKRREEEARRAEQEQEEGQGGADPFEELDGLIGLQSVKDKVQSILAMQRMRLELEKQGMPDPDVSHHLVFTGNPGTGKTTVARIVGRIYRKMGILKKGHLVEVGRADLVGEYIGHTEQKTKAAVKKALDGVLFIDEAYALAHRKISGNDFGKEAIAVLLAEMENKRDRLMVIAAGYTKEMADFIGANPGLKSRLKTEIAFPDYSDRDLATIFEKMLSDKGVVLSTDAIPAVAGAFAWISAHKSPHFGNGRAVRNFVEDCRERQALRLAAEGDYSAEKIRTLQSADIPTDPRKYI